MQTPILPPDEDLRLAALYAQGILDSPEEREFDELVELAATISKCKMVAIQFVDKDRIWAKAAKGSKSRQMPRSISFCSHTILQKEILIIEDLSKDERFCMHPLVAGHPGLRFYAGAPIVSTSGFNIGTVCICDHKPHSLTSDEAKMLSIIANQVTRLLELHHKNRIIRERAEELLNQGKQLLLHVLSDQEKEKQHISTELHENIAQVLSATKFYLDTALIANDPSLIVKVSEQLDYLSKMIQKLSKAITPTTLKKVPLNEMISDHIKEISARLNFPITYSVKGRFDHLDEEKTLAAFRIAEAWISSKEDSDQIQKLMIHLKGGRNMELSLDCIKNPLSSVTSLKELTISALKEQIEAFGGSVIQKDHDIKIYITANSAETTNCFQKRVAI